MAKVLTLIAENIGGTCQISPQKDKAFLFISSSLICSHGSRWMTYKLSWIISENIANGSKLNKMYCHIK